MLGEAGVINSDDNYGGDSSFSLNYFRSKVLEFQVTLNGVDMAYQAAVETNDAINTPELAALIGEYEDKITPLKLTAEALNAGSALINNFGGRSPMLSIPSTLGFVFPPLLFPAAVLAAVAGVAYYAAWGRGYSEGVLSAIGIAKEAAALIEDQPQREIINNKISQLEIRAIKAREFTVGGVLASIGGGLSSIAKWLALGALGYVAWKTWSANRD